MNTQTSQTQPAQSAEPNQREGRQVRKTLLPIHNMSGHLTLYDRRSRCQNKGGGCSYKSA